MSKVLLSDRRDIPLLIYVWKWKCATATALHARFFKTSHYKNTHRRLMTLRKAGYLEPRSDFAGVKWGWSVTQKGFRAIDKFLPSLRQSGYAPHDLQHDLYVAAIHQGDWFEEVPPGWSLLTEQELRRVSFDEFPLNVPRTDRHLPDGYWYSSKKLIALEVELTRKSLSDYSRVGFFYASYPAIETVLWVVPRMSLAEAIASKLSQVAREQVHIHNFILLSSILRDGWNAVPFMGPKTGSTLLEILDDKGTISRLPIINHPCFRMRKSPDISSLSTPALSTVSCHSVDNRPHK